MAKIDYAPVNCQACPLASRLLFWGFLSYTANVLCDARHASMFGRRKAIECATVRTSIPHGLSPKRPEGMKIEHGSRGQRNCDKGDHATPPLSAVYRALSTGTHAGPESS